MPTESDLPLALRGRHPEPRLGPKDEAPPVDRVTLELLERICEPAPVMPDQTLAAIQFQGGAAWAARTLRAVYESQQVQD